MRMVCLFFFFVEEYVSCYEYDNVKIKNYQGDKVENEDVEPRGLSVDVHQVHVRACRVLSLLWNGCGCE